jgi:hypothetical protein
LIYNIKLEIFKLKFIFKLLMFLSVFIGLINSHYLIFFTLKKEKSLDKIIPNIYDILNKENETISVNNGNMDLDYIKTLLFKMDSYFENLTDSSNLIEIFNESLVKNLEERKILEIESKLSCYPIHNSTYNFFLSNIWNWLDSSLYSFIPLITMIVCSISIIAELNKKFISIPDTNHHIEIKQKKRNNQILLMLCTTNFFFVLFSLPYSITNNNFVTLEPGFILVTHMLAYSNNSFNFLFYIIFSGKYRSKLSFLVKILFLGKQRVLNKIDCNQNLSLIEKHVDPSFDICKA